MAIYQFYLGDTLTILDQNPYQLIYDIKGIGFNKADQLARNIGIAYNDNERLKAALLYTLEEECIKQGHTYLPINVVIDLTVDVLNYQDEEVIEPEKLDEMLQYLNEEKRLIIDNEQVVIPSLDILKSKVFKTYSE